MKTRRIATALAVAAAIAAALWVYDSRATSRAAQTPVAIQDGKTIDFSGGSPVVKDSAADKAALAAALREIDAATKTVTFPATAQAAK